MSTKLTSKLMILLIGGLMLCNQTVNAQFYDGLQVEFGKNRIQYRDFIWQYHSVGHFEIYFYQGGQELAGAIASIVEETAKELNPYFGNNLEGPIQILVYNNIAEFRQSNIGVFALEEEGENIGGMAKIVGNKLFLYGRGDRAGLERDLRGGLARIALQQTIYSGRWQDALRNSSMLQIPEWFEEGLVNYISWKKSARANIYSFDAARSGALANIDRSEGDEAGELGSAVWDYIADVYGIPAISNVLYMVRISRSVEGGFRFATGLNLPKLISEVIDYQIRQTPIDYAQNLPSNAGRKNRRSALKDGGELPFKLKKRYDYICLSQSPDGKNIAFITDERGQRKVWTCEVGEENNVVRRAKHGHKLDLIKSDLLPSIAWHPDGTQFTYSIVKKGQPVLVTIRLDEKKIIEKELFRIDEVLSMDYSPDGRSIVFSGMTNGRSDLYIYRVIGNLQEPLWEDRFDDLNPRYTSDGKSIIFSSNRPDETLRGDRKNIPFSASLDLFLCHLDEDETRLERLINTPNVDERYPIPLPNDEFVYLSEYNGGRQESNWGWADSTILSIDTIIKYRYFFDTRVLNDLNIPILSFHCDTANGFCYGITQIMQHSYRTQLGQMPLTEQRSAEKFLSNRDEAIEKGYIDFVAPNWAITFDDTEADIRDYKFEFEKRIEKTREEIIDKDLNEDSEDIAVISSTVLKPRNYRLNFALQKLQSQVSNAFRSQFYRTYNGSVSSLPGLGNATEIRICDLFEDKHIIGGYNISANLNNSMIGIAYYNLEGRVDKMLSIQRQGTTSLEPNSFNLIETQTHFARYRISYPIDEVRSLRAGIGLRLDRAVTQGTEMFSLTTPNRWTEQVGLSVAWVHDDTRTPTLNIREGLRAKVWAEYYLDGFDSSFGTVGFDVRRYYKIYANAIFALRAAGNWSIGEHKLLQLLGGTDNSLSFNNNYTSPIDENQAYTYQTNITPLRGFSSNARNGTHAAIINAEIRIPIWSTIFSEPAKTDIVRHFQIVCFTDIGSAWIGVHPYSDENTFNTTTFENNPITVSIDNNREPIIYDFGWGLRSRVLGYWVSANWGWGVDDDRVMPKRFSLSLNFDF
jgi:WD40 repeat protein